MRASYCGLSWYDRYELYVHLQYYIDFSVGVFVDKLSPLVIIFDLRCFSIESCVLRQWLYRVNYEDGDFED